MGAAPGPASRRRSSKSAPTASPEDGQAKPTWFPRRTQLVALVGLLLALAMIGGGIALGWKFANDQQASREPAPLPSVLQVPQSEYDGNELQARMPDVRGLDRKTAAQVLADAGLDIAQVGFQPLPWAGAVGKVVEQLPVAGTENPAGIVIKVSEQARVPTVSGKTAATVTSELSALGVEVVYSNEYRTGATGGTALRIEPAPGQPLPDRVTLTVAETPSSVMLSAQQAIEGGGSTGSVDLGGTTHPSSTVLSASSEPGDNSWLISKVVDSVEGTVGVPDTDDPSASATVELFADGKRVGRASVAYGRPVTMRASVAGALRLTVRVTSTSPDGESADVALGDFALVGGADALKKLGEK